MKDLFLENIPSLVFAHELTPSAKAFQPPLKLNEGQWFEIYPGEDTTGAFHEKDFDQVVAVCEAAQDYSQIADLYIAKGDSNKAIDFFEKAKNFFMAGSTAGIIGDYKRAMKNFENIGEFRLASCYASKAGDLKCEQMYRELSSLLPPHMIPPRPGSDADK